MTGQGAWIWADLLPTQALTDLERVAPSQASIIIVGETGTGKEMLARHLHERSGRKGPFIAVNSGAFADPLAESELFGHEAGSFTGAEIRRRGWFEAANGGTLFLDEIAEFPLPLQAKLLRVLKEREVARIGSRQATQLDIRVIASINVEPQEALYAGRFRPDLYYRLSVWSVNLAPLRERTGAIVPLARFFLRKYSQELGKAVPELTAEAGKALECYRWPGNVRELESVIHAALLLTPDRTIGADQLRLSGATRRSASPWHPPP